MNKSLEALLRGYICFKVNDKIFYLYNSALYYQEKLVARDVDVVFIGRHIFKGWVTFYSFTCIKTCREQLRRCIKYYAADGSDCQATTNTNANVIN